MPLIDIQDVGMTYGPAKVLQNVTLNIDEGDFVCLLGKTGCGKSTLLRLVLGSEKPSTGRILIDGSEHSRPDRTRGYVPQKYSLFPDRTVLSNITFGPIVSEFRLVTRWTPAFFRRRRELRDQAMDWIRRMGLREEDAVKYPDQLSGGMQQRVAIAQALIMRPRILLMDEAFSALDPGSRRDMQALLRGLWEDARFTVLFVTHNTQEALVLASRVVVLSKEHGGSRICWDRPILSRGPAAAEELERACGSHRDEADKKNLSTVELTSS